MNKSVIFDFDGVIIDSLNVQKKAFFESYKLVCGNGTPDFDEFMNHSGSSLENIFRKMNLPLSMIKPYKEISEKNIEDIIVVKGMPELVKFLSVNNYKIGLCTGKDRKRTIDILNNFNLLEFFDAVVCSDEVNYPKPHPESLEKVMLLLSSHPDSSVMIGDAVNDIICAKKADVTSIAVSWGVYSSTELEKKNPDYLVSNVEELLLCIMNVFINRKDYPSQKFFFANN